MRLAWIKHRICVFNSYQSVNLSYSVMPGSFLVVGKNSHDFLKRYSISQRPVLLFKLVFHLVYFAILKIHFVFGNWNLKALVAQSHAFFEIKWVGWGTIHKANQNVFLKTLTNNLLYFEWLTLLCFVYFEGEAVACVAPSMVCGRHSATSK